jgi:hypothetical protein
MNMLIVMVKLNIMILTFILFIWLIWITLQIQKFIMMKKTK